MSGAKSTLTVLELWKLGEEHGKSSRGLQTNSTTYDMCLYFHIIGTITDAFQQARFQNAPLDSTYYSLEDAKIILDMWFSYSHVSSGSLK